MNLSENNLLHIIAGSVNHGLAKYLVTRILLSIPIGIVAAIAGESATYFYCWNNDVRPPLEGIPFFSFTVVLLSLLLFAFLNISNLVGKPLLERMSAFFYSEVGLADHLRSHSTWKFVRRILRLFLIILVFLYILFVWFLWLFSFLSYFSIINAELKVGENIFAIIPATCIVAFAFWVLIALALLEIRYKISSSITAAVMSVLVCLFMIALMHNQNVFGYLLAQIKYGGKTPVVVEYEESGGAARPANIRGKLLIRTSTALIIIPDNSTTTASLELPLAHVRKIAYPIVNEQTQDQ